MSDPVNLTHDFDFGWLAPLDIDQIHFLLTYMAVVNHHFEPGPGIANTGMDATGVHDWDDLTFYINSNCVNSETLPKYVFQRALENYARVRPNTTESIWQLKYSQLAQIFRDPWLSFMNYGYFDFEGRNAALELDPADEEWRMCIQLYNRLLHSIDANDKDLLEIGSGRGGGASFIARYKKPRSYLGLDGTQSNTMFSREAHSASNLSFDWALAESFDLPDESRDIVLNLESCNYYRPFSKFVDNVYNVLRPGGYFVMSTMGMPAELCEFTTAIESRGFVLEQQEDVSFNVLRALEEIKSVSAIIDNHDTLRRRSMYYQTWRLLYGVDEFLKNKQRYCRYSFRKPE